MVFRHSSEESGKQIAGSESDNPESLGFWSEAWNSFKYSGIQSPIIGAVQLSDRYLGTNLQPKVQFMDAPQENKSWSGWLGQQVGGAVGITLDFALLGKFTKGMGSLLNQSSIVVQKAESISAASNIWVAAKTGFAYDLIFKPVHEEEGNFELSRLRNGTVGGVTFGVLTGSTLSAKYGLIQLADTISPASSMLGSTLKNEVVLGGLSGMASGAPAAVASSYGHSLLTRGEIPTAKEINDSLLSFTTVGGLLGAGHGLAELPAGKRPGTDQQLAAQTDQLIAAKGIQRTFDPNVRRYKVVKGNAEQIIESLRRSKSAQGQLVLQELTADGSLGAPLDTWVQHFGPDNSAKLNKEAAHKAALLLTCHQELYNDPQLLGKHPFPQGKGETTLSLVKDASSGSETKDTLLDVAMTEKFNKSGRNKNDRSVSLSAKVERLELTKVNNKELVERLAAQPDTTELVLHDCPELTTIPELPAATRVRISKCHKLKTIPELPNATEVEVSECSELKRLPNYPNATTVAVSGCWNLTEIPDLPSTTTIKIEKCHNLRQIGKLESVTNFSIDDNFYLSQLPDLPAAVCVDVSSMRDLTELPDLPLVSKFNLTRCRKLTQLGQLPSVTDLTVRKCDELTELPELSKVTTLTVSDNSHLAKLPELPSANKVHVDQCGSLITLPELPSAKSVEVSSCYDLKQLPDLPVATKIKISNCHKLTQLPHLPSAVDVDIYSCRELTEIPSLPSVRNMKVKECDGLKQIVDLPSAIEVEINNCFILTDLPALPSAKRVTINKCHKLLALPSLPSATDVEVSGCFNLKQVPDLPAATSFKLSDLHNLEEVSANLPMLQKLILDHCPNLHKIPKLPAGVELIIDACDKLEAAGVKPTLSSAAAKWRDANNLKLTAEMLLQSADAITTHFPNDANIVLLGRDSWPLVPLLRHRGMNAQYFLWSRIQRDDPAIMQQTGDRWLQEVPRNSFVIDTGYQGTILDQIRNFDPTINGYLMNSTGKYPEIPGLHLERSRLVEYIERFPKLLGRCSGFVRDYALCLKKNRDAEEASVSPRDTLGITAQLLRLTNLPEPWVKRYIAFTGCSPQQRLGLGKFAPNMDALCNKKSE